ncbi:hypothetical protein DFH11DRAFT_1827817 [Phellopilus nigrolimitatus]|nr:hypothetical protein DFH11DRAFT_1827817 [Phellopilus nigrolimitatus]
MSKRVNKRDLSSLPPEMFAEVIRNCHPKDVAHMRQTCKGAKHFCDSRDVQKSLLQKLDVTQAPNITPDEWTASMRPRLLPGGRYVLLVNGEDLQLWSFEHSTRVWVAESPNANFRICDTFDFELLQGGKVLIITAGFSNPGERFVCVYKFDFASQKGTCVFKCGIPDSDLSPQLMVRGELVMASYQRRNQIILFNWKNSEAVILDYHHVNIASLGALVEDHHIIIALRVKYRDLEVAAISVSSLDGKWTNVRQAQWKHVVYSFSQENEVENRDVLCLTLPNQSGGNVWRRILGMHAFTPAWYPKTKIPGTAEIFVVAYEILEDSSANLVSYRVQLSGHAVGVARRAVAAPGIAWRLSLVAQDRAVVKEFPPCPSVQNISNAGRMFARRGKDVYCYQLFCKNQQPVGYSRIPGPDEPKVMSVEPVSGAVVIGAQGLLRVARFDSGS